MGKSMSRSSLISTKIDRAINLQRKVKDAGGKILGKIARLAISAFGAVARFLVLDFSSLWDTMVNAYFAIKEFDWNASDKEIEKMIEANNKAIATRAASALGEQLGFGAVRLANFFLGKAARAAGSIKVPVLSARVGLALAEEQNEEALSAVRSFIGVASAALVSNQFLSSILYLRRNELFGQQSIKNDDLPNGSISEKIENKLEKLPEFWRQPAESFIEGFEEGIISAGYVVSFTIDDHIAALKYAQQDRGPTRKIELVPDPENPEGILEISAPQEVFPEVLPQILATHEQLREKDVGQILGEPIDDRAKPQPSGRFLQITFYAVSKPPVRKKGKLADRAVVTIPDVETRVGWGELKSIPKFTRGPVYCHLRLTNGRRMSVWAATESEGENLLNALAKFSKGKVVAGSFRSSQGSRETAPERSTCFPFYAALVTPRPPKGEERPKTDRPRRVEIWREKQPENFKPL